MHTEAAYERYQQLHCYKGKKYNVAILLNAEQPTKNKTHGSVPLQ